MIYLQRIVQLTPATEKEKDTSINHPPAALLALTGTLVLLAAVLLSAPDIQAKMIGPTLNSEPGSTSPIYLPLVGQNFTTTVHIWGRVALEDGTGLAGIDILTATTYISECHGGLLTTTDEQGLFNTYRHCPPDQPHQETFMICPSSEAYTFSPPVINWETLGCRGIQADFTAYPRNAP
jgi:hypothetical protein